MATIRINGDTSGYVQLSAPAVAGNTNLTLPLTGFGKVLQVVQGTTTVATFNGTSTYADTNLSATITPSSVNSKILILVSQNGCQKTSGNASSGLNLKLLRGATDLGTFEIAAGYTGTTLTNTFSVSFNYLDSPETTSSTIYKTQFANYVNASGVYVQGNPGDKSTIILVEIGP